MEFKHKIEALRRQGVEIPAPQTLEIGDEVKLEQIQGPDTVLHMGTKLYGERLMIMPGCRIGYEEPATLENCAVGPWVKLNGGYFSEAVFLDRVVVGKGAQIRVGTLMEEESSGAHAVGLKQTVLLPFVTLGSLVNFCDVLMAGGTSRRDHSEVGSSFIHFNYTPFGRHGDKATPSLVGDVPRGVMLRSARIFLGGHGGLVGPVHVDYGTVLAAGFVYRRYHGPDELVVGEKMPVRTLPFNPLRYSRIRDKIRKNLNYIGNLVALWHWYDQVRVGLASGDEQRTMLYERAKQTLASCIVERIKRLAQIAGYMEDSFPQLEKDGHQQEAAAQRAFAEAWPEMAQSLAAYKEKGQLNVISFDQFKKHVVRHADEAQRDYLFLIRHLPNKAVKAGTAWLQQIVKWAQRLEDAYLEPKE
jgi:UDP-N-acetylglucosamine/UDP-N-acetylgalactosamine diphosphorylase